MNVLFQSQNTRYPAIIKLQFTHHEQTYFKYFLFKNKKLLINILHLHLIIHSIYFLSFGINCTINPILVDQLLMQVVLGKSIAGSKDATSNCSTYVFKWFKKFELAFGPTYSFEIQNMSLQEMYYSPIQNCV